MQERGWGSATIIDSCSSMAECTTDYIVTQYYCQTDTFVINTILCYSDFTIQHGGRNDVTNDKTVGVVWGVASCPGII